VNKIENRKTNMGTTATAPIAHTKPKSGGQILAAALEAHGVERLSCVAGESYLPVLDALLDHPSIQTITCRHEGEAAFMAESWGKLTGKAGVCFVTRGPGATNAAIGVHTAMQDSTPLILFVGQVARADKGREAFQEFDTKQAFTPWAKEAFDIPSASQIPEAVNRAFRLAQSGRMGPVVVGLPEDILIETADVSIAEPETPSRHGLNKADLSAIREALKKTSKPLIIAGGSGWSDAACADLERFAKTAHIPVVAAWRCHDVIDSRSSCFAGELGIGANPKLIEKIKTECDLIVALGTRLDEITVQGYTLFDLPTPRQTLIHIHSSKTDIGKVYAPTLGIVADVNDAAAALAGAGFGIDGRGWDGWRGELRGLCESFTALDLSNRPRWNGADMNAIFAHLRDVLPDDTIITSDAGNFSIWVRRYLRHGRPPECSPPSAAQWATALRRRSRLRWRIPTDKSSDLPATAGL
jgi:acetolactate synthase-1/2/3 large subunit